MEFKEAKELAINPTYWKSMIEVDSKLNYLTTVVTLKSIGISTQYCDEEDDFYMGDVIISCDLKSTCSWRANDYVSYGLAYKRLKYCDTLYIDFWLQGKFYTKAIRIRKGKSLQDKEIQEKIHAVCMEFLDAYLMSEALFNYNTDNCLNCNLDRRLRKEKEAKLSS